MKTNSHFCLALFVFAFCVVLSDAAHGQTTQPTPDTDVVKITTKLVQLDLLVVDKDGKQVRGLSKEDFELLQDGKPQKITNFSYVDRPNSPIAVNVDSSLNGKQPATAVPVKLGAADTGRVLTFIVDDLYGSALVVRTAKEGIEKFIREQMLPNDMVAIYQTRGGASRFQQYTNNKATLLATAAKIRWYPSMANYNGSIWEPVRPDGNGPETEEEKQRRKEREQNIKNNSAVGALGVMRYVVQGLKPVPGRKIVFLMSDGISLHSRNDKGIKRGETIFHDVIQALKEVTDLANRSAVVINTIDARGVFNALGAEAADGGSVGMDRLITAMDQQDGLVMMADETGGTFYQNQNYIDTTFKQALSRETGYYLLGYEPDENSFKDKRYNKISAKVKRPGLKVISRAGYIGKTDETLKPNRKSVDSELYEALVSPLPRPGMNVGLTAYYANSPEANDFVRSMFHIDGSEITFSDEPGGAKKAVLDVIAVTMNERNELIDEFTRTHTVRFDANTARLIQERGLVYSADVPVKKPGTYTFRVAVRDGNSRSLGSASQMVTVPDLTKPEMYMSGLFVTNVDSTGAFTKPTVPTAETAISLPLAGDVPAIRKFQRGKIIAYNYDIYNAKIDAKLGRPRLSAKVNLYKDGVLIAEGNPEEIDLKDQKDLTHIENFSYLQLQKNADVGEYALQIIITDLAAGSKGAVSSQWIDFEVID